MANEFKFEIVKSIAALRPTNENGWTREVNLVSYNGAEPKVDIRDWNSEHTKMSKGITMTVQEAKLLIGYLGVALNE